MSKVTVERGSAASFASVSSGMAYSAPSSGVNVCQVYDSR